jgi:hypothetical protein
VEIASATGNHAITNILSAARAAERDRRATVAVD